MHPTVKPVAMVAEIGDPPSAGTRSRGELIVEFADRKVTYRSIAELLIAEQHIAQALSTTPRAKQSYGVASKGFGLARRCR